MVIRPCDASEKGEEESVRTIVGVASGRWEQVVRKELIVCEVDRHWKAAIRPPDPVAGRVMWLLLIKGKGSCLTGYH